MSKHILKCDDIELMEGSFRTHFLNKNAVRVTKSLGDLTGLKGIGFHMIEVQPGFESTEYHYHHFEDECVYILSGNATVTIGGENYQVGAGDFIGHPAGGEAHTMKNTGETKLVFLVVGQRLPHDIADYPNLNKRLYMNNEVSDLVNIDDITKA